MHDSVILDWINENQYRSYPLRQVADTSALEAVILDACLVFSSTVPSPVNLITITAGTNYTISVTGQTDFTVTNAASATYPYYARNSQGSLLVFGEALKNVSTATFNLPFEPSVCYEFDAANWGGVSSIAFNGSTPLTGEIEFSEGYQFGIDIDVATNTINLDADKNKGTPIDCTKFFPTEAPDDCDDIISFINGVGVINNGDDFRLTAGENIAIYPDQQNHRVYIGLNFSDSDQDICPAIIPNPRAL